jgi:hypothetical protein
MGITGPIPKREDQRRRHTKEEDRATKATGGTPAGKKYGPEPPEWLDGFALQFYESFRTSGQAVYYQDSDWAVLALTARNVMAEIRKPSAVMLASILHACTMLGATEGDRRRIRIELQPEGEDTRDPDTVAGEVVATGWAGQLSLAPAVPDE